MAEIRYVSRLDGAVTGVFARLQPGIAEEPVDAGDDEVAAFLRARLRERASISDRQFFQQLAIQGIITEEQALASNAAVIPAPLLAIIEQLPAAQQFDAKMKVSGATTFLRGDPLTIAIGQAYGMSPADIDLFFSAAAAL